MRKITALFVYLPVTILIAVTPALSATQKLPIVDGKEAVAVVNGEPITRGEYEEEITSLHSGMSDGKKTGPRKPGKLDYSGILKRLIDARLILQEARNIGINELPEVRELVESYSKKTLRTVLLKEHTKDVKPDEALADRLYKKAAGEWKFGSVMFKNEDDARKMETEIKAGKNFDELAEKANAEGKAKGGGAEGYFKSNVILSKISDVLSTMEVGSVSPVISVPGGYALLKLDDVRYEESPEKKEAARKEALEMARSGASLEFVESLKKKHAKTNQELLDSLDYGSSVEEFDKLMKDERVIAEIEGEAPIKVSDLSDELRQKYFHGIERVIGKKDMAARKYLVFDGMLEKRVLLKEAAVEDIKKNDSYQVSVRTYENAVVFGVFVQKVVIPEIIVMESEAKAYYDEHRSEYTSPELMKLDSIVFKKRGDAETAMQKLREGDQLSWLKAHAEGQVDKDAKELIVLEGNVVTTNEFPDGLMKALSGVSSGDLRLYESPEGYFYVISIVTVYPPETEPYLSVREAIAKNLFDERVKKGVEDWAEKLRAMADVKIYMEDIDKQ